MNKNLTEELAKKGYKNTTRYAVSLVIMARKNTIIDLMDIEIMEQLHRYTYHINFVTFLAQYVELHFQQFSELFEVM